MCEDRRTDANEPARATKRVRIDKPRHDAQKTHTDEAEELGAEHWERVANASQFQDSAPARGDLYLDTVRA